MTASNVRLFSLQQPTDAETVAPLPRSPANEADLFNSRLRSDRDKADRAVQVLESQRIGVEQGRDEQLAAIRERAIAEETAVLRQADDDLTEIDRKLSENHLIKARCEAALAIQE